MHIERQFEVVPPATPPLGVMLSGDTRVFPVIGDPIGQVRSPRFLTEILVDRGENAIVFPAHVSPEHLQRTLTVFEYLHNLDGILVTIPHKVAAHRACTRLTDRARFAGSVNVMRKQADGWFGDNTDGQGFVDGIETAGCRVDGARVLLVGCGGAGVAIAHAFLEHGVDALALHDIDLPRRDEVFARLAERFPGRVSVGNADPAGFDIVANATPMGMRPDDPLPVDIERLDAAQFVACVVTKPEIPPLIVEARRRGCRTMTGAGMFDAQAPILVDFLLGRGREGSSSPLRPQT